MGDDEAIRAQLVRRIATRRSEVARYVRTVRPWSNRLATISVISGALVAAATAGPALGASSFTEKMAKAFGLPSDLAIWQVACLIALVVSLVSTVSSAMLRRQDIVARVGAAESAATELSALGTAVEFHQIELADAVARYQQLTATVPFVDEDDSEPVPAPVSSPAPARTTGAPATTAIPSMPYGQARVGPPRPYTGPVPRPVARTPYRG